jgi:hypothetical protein
MLGNDCRLEVVDTLQPRQSGLYTGLDQGGAWVCILARDRGLRLGGMAGEQLRDMAKNLAEVADEMDADDDDTASEADDQLAKLLPVGRA